MTNRSSLMKGCSLAALAAATMVPAMIACGGSTPAATGPNGMGSASAGWGQPPPGQYPQQQPGYGQQQYPQQQPGYAQQPGMQPPMQPGMQQQPAQPGVQPQPGQPGVAPAPMASVVTTDPNSLQALFAQAAAAGQAMLQQPGAVAAGDPVDACLSASQAKHAPGMAVDGQVAKGQLQEGGQHLDFMVTMQPGKCYTIIGCSPTGQVKNLDLNVLSPPFYNVLAGQDTTDNNTPVVGSAPHPMCPIIPLPLQYKVDIAARSGSGNVGVQMYSKAK